MSYANQASIANVQRSQAFSNKKLKVSKKARRVNLDANIVEVRMEEFFEIKNWYNLKNLYIKSPMFANGILFEIVINCMNLWESL